MDLCSAQGMLLKLGDQLLVIGNVPASGMDYTSIRAALVEGIATSDHLNGLVPPGQDGGEEVAGIAIMELPDDGR